MKKILSILGIISLSTIISTNIIACNTPNKKNKPNKPIEPKFIPQQPPKNSNWKLIDRSNFINEIKKPNDKWYIGIIPYNKIYIIYKVKNNIEKNKFINKLFTEHDNVYRCDGFGEPQKPSINKDTGEITNWN
ncbi:lipoprotein [Spiroplasma sp. ald]|uniref:lipoprotein n=1 Tax=Spiroplasma sp. ald TaxID=2490849 RepID=UPI0037DDCA9C